MCVHGNQMKLRLITYTQYGPMVGCLACGTSWLVREAAGGRSSREEASPIAERRFARA
jgi:hypothetical protein